MFFPGIKNFQNLALKTIKILAILSILSVIIYSQAGIEKEEIDISGILDKVLPEESFIIKKTEEEFTYYEVYNQAEDLTGFLF